MIKIRSILFLLVSMCVLNFFYGKNGSFMKEALAFPGGNKLFPNRSISAEAKKFITRYDEELKGWYNPVYFKDWYDTDQRFVGNIILDFSILCWINNTSSNRDYLKGWCNQAMQIQQWGDNNDLQISHLLFGLSTVYDWHRDKFDKGFQNKLRVFIYDHAKYLYEFAIETQDRFWGGSYWQNHSWVNYTAILASGMALSGDYAREASEWITLARNKIEMIISLLPADGSNHEGLNYSVYGNTWLVRGLTLLEVFDENIFNKSDYLKNYYKFYNALNPDNMLKTFSDIGDSPQYLWFNPCEFFLKLYNEYQLDEYRDLYLFYLDEYEYIKPGLISTVYGLIENTSFENMPVPIRSYFSEDLGVFADKMAVLDVSFFFKSGVPGGRMGHAIANQNPTYQLNRSHEHPDQNHFIIWNKKGFLISDTGYTNLKLTVDHNSLLINDVGQMGEGDWWFKDADVKNKVFSESAGLTDRGVYSRKDVSVVRADAAEFYPPEVGLKKFNRTIVWLKPMGFIVHDSIETEEPEVLKLIFHSSFDIEKSGENECVFKDKSSICGKFISLSPQGATIDVSDHYIISHSNNVEMIGEKITIERHMQSNQEEFLTLILPQ